MEIQLPNKSHFKMNEVCGFTGVKPYVLRFWESEFDQIETQTSSTGHKLYSREGIEAILQIKNLLFEQKMSIDEAKFALQTAQKNAEEFTQESFLHDTDENEIINKDQENLEKLVIAKQKLQGLIDLTNSLI